MNIYKITFVNNAPVLCAQLFDSVLDGSYHYEHLNGRMIYAIVKADDEQAAIEIAQSLADKIKENLV